MPRVKTNVASHRRKKKILERAKGYRGGRSKLLCTAREAVDHALRYSYIHRRQKKRDFRALWIQRINAASRQFGLSYSCLISGLKKAGVALDRKSLSDLAVSSPTAFATLAGQVKSQAAKQVSA